MTTSTGPYLAIADVGVTFGRGKREFTALKNVDLNISRGEFVSIIGHSGCGKSTLLGTIAGLVHPTSGSVTLAGEPITAPGPDRGLVFQNHSLLPWLSVFDNVYHALDAVLPNRSRLDKRVDVEEMLGLVGLWPHRDKKPHEISGGMKQRTAIARAFVVHPKVLLLDEPFSALDALTKPTLHDALIDLWQSDGQSETVIMVTHDIDEAIYLSDRVVVMTNGPAAGIGEVVDIPLARPRDKRELLASPEYVKVKSHLLQLLTQTYAKAA